MGSKKPQINSQVQEQQQGENQDFQAFKDRNNADLNASRQRADELYSSIEGGYKSLVDPATGYVTANYAGQGSGGGGGGGGVAPYAGDPRFGDAENSYRKFMGSTGGFDQTYKGNIDTSIGNLQDIAKTGGVSDESVGRVRGAGVFDEFANTGGLSAQDRANMRARANSTIPAMFARLRDEAARTRVIQGGYGPGGQALAAKLAREQAGAASDASLNTELGITNAVNQGRQWGASSLSGAEENLAALQSSNRLQSNNLAGGLSLGLGSAIQSGQEFGTSGLNQMAESARADATQREAIAAQRAGISASSQSAANQLALEQKLASYSGLQSLYSSVPEEYQQDKNFDLNNRLIHNNIYQGYTGQLYGNNKPFDWGSLLTAGISGAGAAAGRR